MVCAAPWKTCNCPWFNYQHIEDNDRLNDMRVPYTTHRPDDVVEVIELPDDPTPPPVRRSSTRARPRSRRDRDLDREDQALASHMHSHLHINPAASQTHRADPAVEVYGVGNATGHHMNDSYAMRPAANIAARTIPRTAAPRASFFSRRVERPAAQPTRPSTAAASAMAGLSRDGSKRGQNRVGTWLSHVSVDEEAIHTQARDVEVDEWRCDGTMIGID
jgi:ariadne-1